MTLTENVTVAFRYSQQDYVRAMRRHYATRFRLPLDVSAIVLLAGLSIYLLHSGFRINGIVLLGLVVIFSLMLISAFTVIPYIVFRREPKFRDEYVLTFSPQGIHFHTTHIESDLQWSMYTSVLVDGDSYILYYGQHQFTLIPKRVFQDVETREVFEQLLRQKISKITDRT